MSLPVSGKLHPIPLLASRLDGSEISSQTECPLFHLPGELRERIYHYVFSAEPVYPSNDALSSRPTRHWSAYPRVHTSLLRTCRAIYAEACLLPVELNPAYCFHSSIAARQVKPGPAPAPLMDLTSRLPAYLSAWQLATLSSVVLVTQQAGLERKDNYLSQIGERLLTAQRHAGLYVADKAIYTTDASPNPPASTSGRFSLRSEPPPPSLPSLLGSSDGDSGSADPATPPPVYYRARPITHVTLRLDVADWWTWEDGHGRPRASPGTDRGYALDPYLGTGNEWAQPSAMQANAARLEACRRRGERPPPFPVMSWGQQLVRAFPDLKGLTLRMEVWAEREAELEAIVTCAKTWAFPVGMEDGEGGRLLRWDGRVEVERTNEKLVTRCLSWN